VQGLLLSRRVGGQLSSTLERLAKQVRKRQEFRNKAVAAVGMERSSIWAIGGIMTALIIFLGIKSPDLVVPAFQSATGQKMWQGGVACIVVGFYWMKNVTNIKI
jgi:Flp pilus assembly protein TadB